jgi:hypothetical protein
VAIIVVCPGCRKSFKVNEKFAGKSGNCPGCKHPLTVPAAEQEVKVHTPEAFAGGGKGASGKLATKPIERTEVKVTPITVVVIVAGILLSFAVALIGGKAGLFNYWAAIAPALLVISPPLVWAAYSVLRNDELEPHRGTALYVRVGLCSLVYAALWGVFAYVGPMFLTADMVTWLIVAPPFVVVGAVAAYASLDLDFSSGAMHYAFYAMVTIALRITASIPWPWQT